MSIVNLPYAEALTRAGVTAENTYLYLALINNPQQLSVTILQRSGIPPAAIFNNLHLKLVLSADPYYRELTLSPEQQRLYYDLCNLVGPAIAATGLGPPLISDYSFLKNSQGEPLHGALDPKSFFYRKVKFAATADSYQALLADPEEFSLQALEFLTELYRQARAKYDHYTLWV